MTKATHMWNPIRHDHRLMRTRPIGQNDMLVYANATARDDALGNPSNGMVAANNEVRATEVYLDSLGRWRGLRPGTVLVASAESSDLVKSAADYVCDGTDDQEEIQDAYDYLCSYGATTDDPAGEVKLSGGYFHIGVNSRSPELKTETVSLTQSTGSSQPVTISVSDASQYSVDEAVWLSGGDDGGGNSLEDLNSNTYATISAVDTDTDELEVHVCIETGSMTGVTMVRLPWGVKLHADNSSYLNPTLRGSGYHSSYLSISKTGGHICVMTSASGTSSKAHGGLRELAIEGNKDDMEGGNTGKYLGVFVGGQTSDVHIHNFVCWNVAGPGIVCNRPWGFVMDGGGWLEYSYGPQIWFTSWSGSAILNGTKIISDESGCPAIRIDSPEIRVLNSHVTTSSADTIELRGRSGGIFTGNQLGVDGSGNSIFKLFATNSDPFWVDIVGNGCKIKSDKHFINANNIGLREWTVCGNALDSNERELIINLLYYLSGRSTIRDNHGMDIFNGEMDCVYAMNNTGASIASRVAVGINVPAFGGDMEISGALTDPSSRPGMFAVTMVAHSDGVLQKCLNYGYTAWEGTGGTTSISIGDPLTVTTGGKCKKATTSGDIVYAISGSAESEDALMEVFILETPYEMA